MSDKALSLIPVPVLALVSSANNPFTSEDLQKGSVVALPHGSVQFRHIYLTKPSSRIVKVSEPDSEDTRTIEIDDGFGVVRSWNMAEFFGEALSVRSDFTGGSDPNERVLMWEMPEGMFKEAIEQLGKTWDCKEGQEIRPFMVVAIHSHDIPVSLWGAQEGELKIVSCPAITQTCLQAKVRRALSDFLVRDDTSGLEEMGGVITEVIPDLDEILGAMKSGHIPSPADLSAPPAGDTLH